MPEVKVLCTTGYAKKAIVHHGRLDAGVELITKLFNYSELAANIRAVLRKHFVAAICRRGFNRSSAEHEESGRREFDTTAQLRSYFRSRAFARAMRSRAFDSAAAFSRASSAWRCFNS